MSKRAVFMAKDISMKHACCVAVAILLLCGCRPEKSKPGPSSQASRNRAATSPGPLLRAIDVRDSVYLARIEAHTTVGPTGLLHRTRTFGKTYGPNERDVGMRTEVNEGQLTPGQMAELAAIFAGWDNLADKYQGVVDGPEIEFRYGEKRIVGGSAMPEKVWGAYQRIQELADSMPRVDQATRLNPKPWSVLRPADATSL
jgi:hypothetical protein